MLGGIGEFGFEPSHVLGRVLLQNELSVAYWGKLGGEGPGCDVAGTRMLCNLFKARYLPCVAPCLCGCTL